MDIYSKPLYYDYYNRFSAGDEKPEQVIDMYRELLEKADDKSVVFISVGFLNNLYDLLESEPDNGQRHQKQLPRIGQLKKCLLVLRPG